MGQQPESCGDGEHSLAQIEQILSPAALSSIRSLIVIPDTSHPTLISVLETLTSALQLTRDSLLLHHVLKLLADFASQHPALSHLVRDALISNALHLSQSPRLAAEYLFALASVSSSVDDARFASLCLNSRVSIRMWLLRNAHRLGVKESVMLAMYMGFTRDHYPYVRKLALDGLVGLCIHGGFEDHYVIQGCCSRAVELLGDEESVWSVAVRALCCMVKDMCVDVRLAALEGLGKIRLVSQDVLLQTLTKRVQPFTNMKKFPRQWLQVSASDAAGAFLIGLEDELCEVRSSAYSSLRTLSVASAKFASESLKLLMDVLTPKQ